MAVERGWHRGIEVGVGSGMLMRRLLDIGLVMVGVDLGRRAERRGQVEVIAGQYPDRCRMLWMASHWAADHVADGWADFVFIDAGHSYRAVTADLAAWWPKVRRGGWFGGHDYHSAYPGVIRAVDEALGDLVDLLPGHIWARRPC